MTELTEAEMQDPLMQLVGACPDDGHPLMPQSADVADESVIFATCPTAGVSCASGSTRSECQDDLDVDDKQALPYTQRSMEPSGRRYNLEPLPLLATLVSPTPSRKMEADGHRYGGLP